jgi:hypothetical protein
MRLFFVPSTDIRPDIQQAISVSGRTPVIKKIPDNPGRISGASLVNNGSTNLI